MSRWSYVCISYNFPACTWPTNIKHELTFKFSEKKCLFFQIQLPAAWYPFPLSPPVRLSLAEAHTPILSTSFLWCSFKNKYTHIACIEKFLCPRLSWLTWIFQFSDMIRYTFKSMSYWHCFSNKQNSYAVITCFYNLGLINLYLLLINLHFLCTSIDRKGDFIRVSFGPRHVLFVTIS